MSSDMTSMKSIPWDYEKSNLITTWWWSTEHFDAIIKSDGERYSYQVTNKTPSMHRLLGSGVTMDFTSAEAEVKHVIGKSYAPALGYRALMGSASTSFRIYTGEVVDFSKYEGLHVKIVAATRKQEDSILIGTLQVQNHSVILTDSVNTRKYKIPPHFIKSISTVAAKRNQPKTSSTKTHHVESRTLHADFKPGCTGRPGFFPNTVEHPNSAKWCPVHLV